MSNLTSNWTDEESYIPTALDHYLVQIYFILAGALGVILNVITILAIGLGRNVNKSLKIQLINLAVADCLMAAFYPYAILFNLLDLSFHGSKVWCGSYALITLSAVHASPLCSAAISVEQFVTLYFPLKASQYGTKQKYIVVLVIWFLAIAPELLNAVEADVVTEDGITYCETGTNLDIHQYNLIQTAKYVIPVCIIIIFYSLVLCKLQKEKKNNVIQHSSDVGSSFVNKFQAMLAADALLTVITWLPYNVYDTIVYAIDDYGDFTKQLFVIDVCLFVLLFSNAFSTPIIYFVVSKCFRMDVALLYQKIRCKEINSKATAPEAKGMPCKASSKTGCEECRTVSTNLVLESEM